MRATRVLARRLVRAVRILARDGRIPKPLRWLAALGLLPVPGPVDEAVLLLVGLLLFGFYRDPLREAWGEASMVSPMTSATLHTSEGAIELELYPDDAPKTVANFTRLAGEGYYDGLAFHRVIPDFMVQGGCPRGDGTGGPGYTFEDELNQQLVTRGALAMANAGPNTNGSQFFVVTAEACPWLDGKHTVFGRVVTGLDVVDRISNVDRDGRDRPRTAVTIDRVELGGQASA